MLRLVRIQFLHRVKDATDESFTDVRILFGKIGTREPDVGNQLICSQGADHKLVAFLIRKVVDIGGPRDHRIDGLVSVKRRGGCERVLGVLKSDLTRLNTGVDQHVQHEILRRRVFCKDDLFAAKVTDR